MHGRNSDRVSKPVLKSLTQDRKTFKSGFENESLFFLPLRASIAANLTVKHFRPFLLIERTI